MASVSIAHLGPSGTNAETAALNCATWLQQKTGQSALLHPYATIAQTLQAVAQGETQLAVVPVENSIEGSVTVTLDTLWQLDQLRIQAALVLTISNTLLSRATQLADIRVVYSHPQALAQCQHWLRQTLPAAQLVPANSTTEALTHLVEDTTIAAIASERAAQLYQVPILAQAISDYPDNCTRFWLLSLEPSPGGDHTSLAFIVHDSPGALVKPLQIFAQRDINLSRIESRPSKRSLGDYLFFVDLEADTRQPAVQSALKELEAYTETLKIFGSYSVIPI
ncbi:prephenate dehydratase [Leptolyngbya sp. 'hensonii']|uniref:prephenate dehydratase n=1 Tax=Leptolyngbya sp. 'hensonii' TaxID=1922337 RepID=UPI00094FD95C|nr:prephenate dehydratase [Leptolyngbya sp. 'hensonii']OLP18800.1 prephenate dehydratase [Leptolyngbya sp. 'hensonii']